MKDFVKNHLHWFGHDAFKITGKKTIYIDPYHITNPEKADVICITHEHFDHCSPEDIQKLLKPDTTLVGPEDALQKVNCEKKAIVAPGDRLTIEGIEIEVVPAYNLNKNFHPQKNHWVGYIISVAGKKLYHAGDTDHIPEMKNFKVDIACLPVSGTYVMTPEEAAEAALELKPAVAIPMHWGGGVVGELSDAQKFAKLLKGKIDVILLDKE